MTQATSSLSITATSSSPSSAVYIRHRARMVEQSVLSDLHDTLIACRWTTGTTFRPVVDPTDRASGFQMMTTATEDLLRLAGKRQDGSPAEVVVVDYFPEAKGEGNGNGSQRTEYNTFAMDHGLPGEPTPMELGSNMTEQPYVFTMALYAISDGAAMALMNDLQDRYAARIVRDDFIDLFDYNAGPVDQDTEPPARMEVMAFRHQQSSDQATPWDVNIWYAELHLVDYLDAQDP